MVSDQAERDSQDAVIYISVGVNLTSCEDLHVARVVRLLRYLCVYLYSTLVRSQEVSTAMLLCIDVLADILLGLCSNEST